jgi:hypothetical protein
MQEIEYQLFLRVRTFSSIAVIAAILFSITFSQFLGETSIHWQVVIAATALALGIPHGALDHLVTLPKSKPAVMALFITIYVLAAIVAVIAILEFNVFGFIFVLLMSATHFGIGDAAFINEMDRRGGRKKALPRTIYAVAAGATPVLIPLVIRCSLIGIKVLIKRFSTASVALHLLRSSHCFCHIARESHLILHSC